LTNLPCVEPASGECFARSWLTCSAIGLPTPRWPPRASDNRSRRTRPSPLGWGASALPCAIAPDPGLRSCPTPSSAREPSPSLTAGPRGASHSRTPTGHRLGRRRVLLVDQAVMGPCATEVSEITRIHRRVRQRRYGRGGLSSGPSRCSASISLQRATQSLQIATPGPARTASTCPAAREQNEHWRDRSEPWSRSSVSKDRLGRTGLGRTGSDLTGLLTSALG
jgi:hypothetical protein